MHIFRRLPLAALLVGVLAGCPSEPPIPPDELLPPAPSIVSFRVRKVQMESKVQLLLEWETTGATKVSITDSNRGVVSGVDDQASGAVEIAAPERDTLYVLVAKNARGVSTSAMTTLGASDKVGEILFVATPAEVVSGEPVTLAWSVPGGTAFALSGNELPIPLTERTPQGTLQVFPQRDTTYKLSAGDKALSTNVRVGSALKSFASSSLSGLPGERLTLSWETTGAVRLVLAEGHAGVLMEANLALQPEQLSSGRYNFTIPATSSLEDIFDFTLLMTDGNGTQHKKRLIAYVSGRPRLVSFAAPTLARMGGTFPVSWTAVSVDLVELTLGDEVVYRSSDRAGAAAGAIEVPTPTAPGTYRLTAYGERGGTDVRTFEIDPVDAPKITGLAISPTTVAGGTAAEVTWTATSARRAVLRDSKGAIVATASGRGAEGGAPRAIYPNFTGTYSLEVDNGLGETTSLESAVVTVSPPVVLVPDIEGEIIVGSPVALSPSLGAPGTLLYGIWHTDYVEQAPSTGFIDISGTGSKLNDGYSDDDYHEINPVGFEFLSMGRLRSGPMLVCSNGWMAFRPAPRGTDGNISTSSCSWSNATLPASALDVDALAPLWEDLEIQDGFGGLFWQIVEQDEDRVLVVQWDRVNFRSNPSTEFTFQVQLRNDGAIRFEYANMDAAGVSGYAPNIGVQETTSKAASYPVKPASNSRIEFLGPKPAPVNSVASTGTYTALMKFGTAYMEVAWEPQDLLRPGDLSFSEVMARPAGEVAETGEYFEIYNRMDRPVSLAGFSVQDGNGNPLMSFDSGGGQTTVPARGFLVVGQTASASENDGAGVDYEYGAALLPDLGATLDLVKRVSMSKLSYATTAEDPPGVALVFDPNPFVTSTSPTTSPAVPLPLACTVREDEVFGSQTPPQRGSPGAASRCFPYSYASIPVAYVDISAEAPPLFPASWDTNITDPVFDLSAQPIPIFGQMRTWVKVNSNGFLTFDSTYNSGSASYNSGTVRPTTSSPNASLVIFGRDLEDDPAILGSNVYAKLMPEDPSRATPDAHWVFQWHKVKTWLVTNSLNFEIKLFKDGTIEYHFGDMSGDQSNGSHSVTWIENETGTTALTIGAQAPVIQPNTAYRFRP